jgi:alkylhydroperoxidase family enzyme
MARIPLVDLDDPDLDPEVRQALSDWLGASRTATPQTLRNVVRAVANHPALLRTFGNRHVYGPDAGITPAQRELAYLTASVVNACHY